MRTGKILSFNKIAGVGMIRDVNDQCIKFYISDLKEIPRRGEIVKFDITFNNFGLIATKIAMLNPSDTLVNSTEN